MLRVDVDEADVAVLNQNLTRSKELFMQISRSLNSISNKTATALTKIKPVLREVNDLTESKNGLERGLNLLSDVSLYASQALEYESVLHNSIDIIGLRKYLDTLVKSKTLLKEMKHKIKKFKGIVINFEMLLDKSDLTLQNYLQKLLAEDSSRTKDAVSIMRYFYSGDALDQSNINRIYVRSQAQRVLDIAKKNDASTKPVKRQSNIPYERGSNGINRYTNELIRELKAQNTRLQEIGNEIGMTNGTRKQLLRDIAIKGVEESFSGILAEFQRFFLSLEIVANDTLMLEVIENVSHFEKFLEVSGLSGEYFVKFSENYHRLLEKAQGLFRELIEQTENRVKAAEHRLNDLTVTEIVVEQISKMRKLCEYGDSLKVLMSGMKLGSWLNTRPPARFIGVYTSVIPNINDEIDELSPDYLISCFVSDFIDCLMINLEVGLKQDVNTKKSTQGYYLVKNLVMIETIINRTQSFYHILGNVGLERLTKLKKRFLKLFLDDWNYASYIIIRDMTTITTSNAVLGHSNEGGGITSGLGLGHNSHGHMSSKEKEQVKELFRNFNESFEEALRNYDKHNITDANLRNYLATEIKKLIINAYFKLYDKYGESDFTKNRAKYVKYDKRLFERILNERL